jgi:hypothetical protein
VPAEAALRNAKLDCLKREIAVLQALQRLTKLRSYDEEGQDNAWLYREKRQARPNQACTQ